MALKSSFAYFHLESTIIRSESGLWESLSRDVLGYLHTLTLHVDCHNPQSHSLAHCKKQIKGQKICKTNVITTKKFLKCVLRKSRTNFSLQANI